MRKANLHLLILNFNIVLLLITTLSWRRPLSYRKQSIDLLHKSMDWFLYDNGLRHERVNFFVLVAWLAHSLLIELPDLFIFNSVNYTARTFVLSHLVFYFWLHQHCLVCCLTGALNGLLLFSSSSLLLFIIVVITEFWSTFFPWDLTPTATASNALRPHRTYW